MDAPLPRRHTQPHRTVHDRRAVYLSDNKVLGDILRNQEVQNATRTQESLNNQSAHSFNAKHQLSPAFDTSITSRDS